MSGALPFYEGTRCGCTPYESFACSTLWCSVYANAIMSVPYR